MHSNLRRSGNTEYCDADLHHGRGGRRRRNMNRAMLEAAIGASQLSQRHGRILIRALHGQIAAHAHHDHDQCRAGDR